MVRCSIGLSNAHNRRWTELRQQDYTRWTVRRVYENQVFVVKDRVDIVSILFLCRVFLSVLCMSFKHVLVGVSTRTLYLK